MLGRYHLRHKLAEGGMATVYLAQIHGEHGFSRWVAVKVVHPEQSHDQSFATMLADEARLIARIHHPNVCSVMDFGMDAGQLYLVMEYLHGETLSAAAKRAQADGRTLPAWIAARALADAARGLDAAHELTDEVGNSLELVHRDVSQGNVLVSYDGPAKVIDFGVVRARGRETKTAIGTVKGKITHMAPEQLRGEEVDRRADVWSLGVTLWETTLGRKLFRGDSPAETMIAVARGPIPKPSEVYPNYPPALEKIVMKALTRDVDKRTPTARAFAHQLEAYLYSLGNPTGHAEVSRWMKRTFSDRLIVRDTLMTAPEDSAPIDYGPLRDELSQSNILSGQVGSGSFMPPAIESPTGITSVELPAAPKTPQPQASQDQDLGEHIDETMAELRKQNRRRGTVVTLLLLLVLGLGAAAAYFATQG